VHGRRGRREVGLRVQGMNALPDFALIGARQAA
jgi:hypothetical protein